MNFNQLKLKKIRGYRFLSFKEMAFWSLYGQLSENLPVTTQFAQKEPN